MNAPLECAGRSDATVSTCGLCGCRFLKGGEVCGTCPLTSSCDLVRCPNCGYQFPRASRIVEWASKVVRSWRNA
jgi:hypothetical protein